MLKISVVTPSYNQAKFLEQTLQSVINQDYPLVEYIVIDGASTDGSVDILKKYDGKISYWVSESDKGQSDAIIKGFQRATGDILCWIASDDILLPGALTKIATFFDEHPNAETVSAGTYFIDAKGRPAQVPVPYTLGVPATYDRFRFYEQDGVAAQSTFFRRSAYDAVGGINPDIRFIMDLDLFTRLANRRQFSVLPELIGAFRIHDTSKTSTIQHVRLDEQQAFFRRHGSDQVPRWKRRALWWRYRVPSLCRKLKLVAMQLAGHVKLPQSIDVRISPHSATEQELVDAPR